MAKRYLYLAVLIITQTAFFKLDYRLILIFCLVLIYQKLISRALSLVIVIGLLSSILRINLIEAEKSNYKIRIIDTVSQSKPGVLSFRAKILAAKNPKSTAINKVVICQTKFLPWSNASKLARGSTVWINARLSSFVINNLYDYEARYLRRGIAADCKFDFVSKSYSTNLLLDRIKNKLIENTILAVNNSELAGLYLAMAIAESDLLSTNLFELYKNAGLAHVLVVSGMHVAMVYLTFYVLSLKIFRLSKSWCLDGKAAKFASIFALVMAYFYTALTGFQDASTRAIISLAIAAIAKLLGYKCSLSNNIFLSAVLLNLVYPGIIFEPGFQLTFSALIGINLSLSINGTWLKQYMLANFIISLCSSIACVYWFSQFYLIGLILNLALAPLLSFLTCQLALLALPLAYFEYTFLIKYLCNFLAWINYILEYANSLPYSSLQIESEFKILAISLIILSVWVLCKFRINQASSTVSSTSGALPVSISKLNSSGRSLPSAKT